MKAIKGAKTGDRKLKVFMESYIPINELRQVGFFNKQKIGRYDYEEMAVRVCSRMGFSNIYQYKKVCNGSLCNGDNCDRGNPNCVSYPPGKFHPRKWKQFKQTIKEKDLFFDETLLN